MKSNLAYSDYAYNDYAYINHRSNDEMEFEDVKIVKWEALEQRRYKKERQHQAVSAFKLLSSCTIIFIMTLGVINSVAANKNLQTRVMAMSGELKKIKEENIALRSEIEDRFDMEYVENYAKTHLKMKAPESYQIIYIDVPKESYTIQYENKQAKEDSKFELSKVTNFFVKAGEN